MMITGSKYNKNKMAHLIPYISIIIPNVHGLNKTKGKNWQTRLRNMANNIQYTGNLF